MWPFSVYLYLMESKNENIISESTSKMIRKALREGIDLDQPKSSDNTLRFSIGVNDRVGGTVLINKEGVIDDSIELSDLNLKSNYEHNTVGLAKGVISSLWDKFEDINNILVQPTAKSRLFWEKVGARRLNDTYHVFQRGH